MDYILAMESCLDKEITFCIKESSKKIFQMAMEFKFANSTLLLGTLLMEDDKERELFSATKKTTNIQDTGKTIESKVMDDKNGLKLRINQIQCHIKAIFFKIFIRKKEQFNIKMVPSM